MSDKLVIDDSRENLVFKDRVLIQQGGTDPLDFHLNGVLVVEGATEDQDVAVEYENETPVGALVDGKWVIPNPSNELSVDFSVDNTNPAPGEEVTFTATGDVGAVLDDNTVTHTYTTEETVSVQLIVVEDVDVDPSFGNAFKVDYIDVEIGEHSFANALDFDGINDVVTTDSFVDLRTDEDFTLMLWIKCGSEVGIIGRSQDNSYLQVIDDGRVIFTNLGTSYTWQDISWTPDPNTWTQLIFTCEGATNDVWCYVNANEHAPLNKGLRVGGFNQFGRMGTDKLQYGGDMDDCVLWSRRLSALEIIDLYNGGLGANPLDFHPLDVVHYWNFNGSGSDTVLTDSVGGNNGTLENFTLPGAWVAH